MKRSGDSGKGELSAEPKLNQERPGSLNQIGEDHMIVARPILDSIISRFLLACTSE